MMVWALSILLVVIAYLCLKPIKAVNSESKNNIILFVGGDFGRSPRMMYHATCFQKETVHVIAHFDSDILPELRGKIKQYELIGVKRGWFYFPKKILLQSLHLWILLLSLPTSTILMQVRWCVL